MFRPVTKQLTCPACGAAVVEATYRPWPGSLVLRSPDGVVVQPEGVALQLRRTERALAETDSAAERTTLEAQREYLRRNLSEITYDLRCPNGHPWVRTMPDLVRRVRRSAGAWVDLA